MKLTRKIIDDISKFGNVPDERFYQQIEIITRGFYKNWLQDAEHIIERGELVETDEEILLIDFYAAVKIDRLKAQIDLVKEIESIDNPEGNEWLKEVSPVVESNSKELEKLSEKLDKVRPQG